MSFNIIFVIAKGAVIIAALPILMLAEFSLRIWNQIDKTFFTDRVSRKDFLADEYQPYVNWVEDWSKPMFQYIPIGFRHFNLDNPIPSRVQNNSLGFRCDEFTPPEPDVLNLIILGGSAAWGSGATSNETTIAGHLEKLINSDGRLLGPNKKSAKCYNLAQVNGYQTQDILSLIFFGPRIKPDIVLSFTGWNELVANYTMKPEILQKYRVFYVEELEGWEPSQFVGTKGKFVKDALNIWAEHKFEIVKRFNASRRKQGHDDVAPVDQVISMGAKLFVEHLQTLQKLATAYGFKHFQFTQPYLYRKANLTEQESKVVELYDEVRPVHGGKETGDYLRTNNVYAPLLRLMDGLPEPVGPVTDLCDIFRDETDTMFYTLVHLNDAGYLKIAEQMYATLLDSSLNSELNGSFESTRQTGPAVTARVENQDDRTRTAPG